MATKTKYCDNCKHLAPTVPKQCKAYPDKNKGILKHYGEYPRIPGHLGVSHAKYNNRTHADTQSPRNF